MLYINTFTNAQGELLSQTDNFEHKDHAIESLAEKIVAKTGFRYKETIELNGNSIRVLHLFKDALFRAEEIRKEEAELRAYANRPSLVEHVARSSAQVIQFNAVREAYNAN